MLVIGAPDTAAAQTLIGGAAIEALRLVPHQNLPSHY